MPAVLNSMAEAVIVFDPGGEPTAMNAEALRLHGYESIEDFRRDIPRMHEILEYSDTVGQPVPFEQSPINRARSGESFHSLDLHVRDRRSGRRWAGRHSLSTLHGAAGKPAWRILTIQDRTEQTCEIEDIQRIAEQLRALKADLAAGPGSLFEEAAGRHRAEQRLHQSEERLRLVVESTPNAMVMTDADGRIVLVNAQAEKLFGYHRQEMLGQSVEMLVPPRFRGRHPEYRRGFMSEPRARPMGAGRDLYGLRKDGTEVPVEIGLNPIRTEDGMLVLAAIVDITQRKQAERSLVESQQQLQAANQRLEQRVAERTAEAQRRTAQLRVLASQLTQAEQKERQRVAYILHEHFQQLLVGAKFNLGMLRIQMRDASLAPSLAEVNKLLDEAIQESRSLTVELSPPILYQVPMGQVLQWLGRWMHEKNGLAVDVRIQDPVDPQDPQLRELLFRSVRELLLNVVRHAGVNEAAVEMARAESDQVRVTVMDRGKGFDPADHRWETVADSGFGLFDIQERLELLGGRLSIESAPGKGTTATLWTPVRLPKPASETPQAAAPQASANPAAAGAAPTAGGPRIRVLLADDHAMVRDGLARLLQMQPDIQVVGQAADGQEAVELARRLHPDVILMDVSMPRLSGTEATHQLKMELPAVHVVGLSMHVDKDIAEAMSAAGAVAYVTKTAPPEQLVAAIRGSAVA